MSYSNNKGAVIRLQDGDEWCVTKYRSFRTPSVNHWKNLQGVPQRSQPSSRTKRKYENKKRGRIIGRPVYRPSPFTNPRQNKSNTKGPDGAEITVQSKQWLFSPKRLKKVFTVCQSRRFPNFHIYHLWTWAPSWMMLEVQKCIFKYLFHISMRTFLVKSGYCSWNESLDSFSLMNALN